MGIDVIDTPMEFNEFAENAYRAIRRTDSSNVIATLRNVGNNQWKMHVARIQHGDVSNPQVHNAKSASAEVDGFRYPSFNPEHYQSTLEVDEEPIKVTILGRQGFGRRRLINRLLG